MIQRAPLAPRKLAANAKITLKIKGGYNYRLATKRRFNLPNKFITAISDDINGLGGALNVEYITAQFYKAKVQEDNNCCTRGRFAENLKKMNIY
jgi:hypothetical protein